MFQADGEELLNLVKELNSTQTGSAKVEQVDEALLKKLSYVAAGDLAPVNAFIGGLAAQEVMKVCLLLHNPVAFLSCGRRKCEVCFIMTESHVFLLTPLHDSFCSVGVHRKIHAHHAVVVLRCPGVPC